MSIYFNWIRLVYLVSAVMISGCEPQTDDKPVQTQKVVDKIQPKRNIDYLRLPLSDSVTTLDPGFIYKEVEIEVVEQLFLGLTDFDPKTYEVVPDLATHWHLYVFYLGVLYHILSFFKHRGL